MDKKFTKVLFLTILFRLFAFTSAYAQTITITKVDPGPYASGSSISARISVDLTSGCVNQANTYQLYLSDASGNFTSPTPIGTYTGFYATFVNGIIPAGTPAGTGYQVMVKSTSPGKSSAAFGPITITTGAGTSAAINAPPINVMYPEVFGACLGSNNAGYAFSNQSTAGSTTTADFYNEFTPADEGIKTFPAGDGTNIIFNAKTANYTIYVKSINGGIVGTKSYTLINNVVNTNITAQGNNTICLDPVNGATITYQINTSNIQQNFPGMVYTITWGDNKSNSYTYCDLVMAGGSISHTYTKSSCGNTANGQNNVFEVDLQATDPYCGNVGTQVTSYAKVLNPAANMFAGPGTGCINKPITFVNNSQPGQDPNSTTPDCANTKAFYNWLVDGVAIDVNYTLNQPFVYKFTTNGIHHVTLQEQTSNVLCPAPDITQDICIQDAPTPAFTIPASICVANGPVTPVNTSVVTNVCGPADTYSWTVTPAAGVTISNPAIAQPQITFSKIGTYQVTLTITGACDPVSVTQPIVVSDVPGVTLSANVSLCGNGEVLNFNTDPGPTTTTFTGTADASATYLWTVVPSNGAAAPAIFTNGTTATSQYPQITFPDYGTYTVSVTYTNGCGSDTKSQVLNFQQAPTITLGHPLPICPTSTIQLTSTITNGTVQQLTWSSSGTGGFSDTHSATPIYTPSAADIAAGTVTFTLDAATSLAAPCNDIKRMVTVSIFPVNTINSVATKTLCTNTPLNYTITSTAPGSTYTWTVQVTSGSASGFNASDPANPSNVINDAIINSDPSNDAVVTYTITPHSNGCDGVPFTLTVTVSPIPVLTQPANNTICSNQPAGIVLNSSVAGAKYTWTSTIAGAVTGNTNTTTPTAASAINDVLVNNSTTTATVTYTITPVGNCAGTPVNVTITVQPLPVPSIPGPDADICNTTTYTLQGNSPAPGTGLWTLDSGQPNVVFSDATNPNAVVSGLLPGNVYTFRWTITNASSCAPTMNVMTLTIDNPTVGGTTSGAITVCAGTNSGTVSLTGQTGNVIRWEASIDNGTTWQNVNNTTPTLQYLNLIQTTQYRAIVQSGACTMEQSTVTIITVNPPAVAANAGPDQSLCNAPSVTLTGNDPTPFTGSWKQTSGPVVTIVSPTTAQTQVTGLAGGNIYKFAWVIKGLAPCVDNEDEVVITNQVDITPSFTADKANGCGAYTVNFTNTSNLLTGNFTWDFGDGSTPSSAVSPSHTYQPRTDGKDTTYIVSLSVVSNCTVRPPFTIPIVVRPPSPIATILPDKLSGCAPFAISVKNTSPGNNQSYTYYLYDGATLVQKLVLTDKSNAVFDPINPVVTKTYTLYMVALDFCGTSIETNHIPITISPPTITPQMFIQDNVTRGCAPLAVTFVNNSFGGTSFTYNIYDANHNIVDRRNAGTQPLNYSFNTPGIYYVTITAADNCTVIESTPPIMVDVSAAPAPKFVADVPAGCNNLTVNFINQTPDSPTEQAITYQYDWDFGDGSPHATVQNPEPHAYTASNTSYTVTLTATSVVTGCSNVYTLQDYITVTPLPATEFVAKPDSVINIPNYNFSFLDLTTGNPKTWTWTFGDGQSSIKENPSHTYADTGLYKVTLITTNLQGCSYTKVHYVRITGVPGQLYLPNAFMPTSLNAQLRTFMAKGSGLKQWRLQIFNTWGQLVWETTKLDSKGAPVEGWDGTFKGSPAQQGVYLWQASGTFINGTEWKGMSYNNSLPKRSGPITLIR